MHSPRQCAPSRPSLRNVPEEGHVHDILKISFDDGRSRGGSVEAVIEAVPWKVATTTTKTFVRQGESVASEMVVAQSGWRPLLSTTTAKYDDASEDDVDKEGRRRSYLNAFCVCYDYR